MNLPRQVRTVFLDTAPLIYYVEKDDRYLGIVDSIFDRIDVGELLAVTSAVSLAECLVLPYRRRQEEVVETFILRIVQGRHTTFVPITQEIVRQAAALRARYKLLLDDAFQLATCLFAGCDAFLTNDHELKKVREVQVLMLDELV